MLTLYDKPRELYRREKKKRRIVTKAKRDKERSSTTNQPKDAPDEMMRQGNFSVKRGKGGRGRCWIWFGEGGRDSMTLKK